MQLVAGITGNSHVRKPAGESWTQWPPGHCASVAQSPEVDPPSGVGPASGAPPSIPPPSGPGPPPSAPPASPPASLGSPPSPPASEPGAVAPQVHPAARARQAAIQSTRDMVQDVRRNAAAAQTGLRRKRGLVDRGGLELDREVPTEAEGGKRGGVHRPVVALVDDRPEPEAEGEPEGPEVLQPDLSVDVLPEQLVDPAAVVVGVRTEPAGGDQLGMSAGI